jgi:hypothetical protein
MINVADRGRGNIGQVSMAVPPRKAPRRHSRNEIVFGLSLLSASAGSLSLGNVYWRTPHVESGGRRARGRFLACLLCEFCPCKVQTPICCLNSEFKRLALGLRALAHRGHTRANQYTSLSRLKSHPPSK